MVKTRSDLKGVRVSSKAPRKITASSNSNGGNSGRSSKKYEGGNSYFPREIPLWQKEITKFFQSKINDGGSSSRDYNSPDLDHCTPEACVDTRTLDVTQCISHHLKSLGKNGWIRGYPRKMKSFFDKRKTSVQ